MPNQIENTKIFIIFMHTIIKLFMIFSLVFLNLISYNTLNEYLNINIKIYEGTTFSN